MKRSIACLLLLVFALIVAPKELIHDLHHHDTVDVHHEKGTGDQLEVKHHHCDVLELTSPVFDGSVAPFRMATMEENSTVFHALIQKNCATSFLTAFLRGPPTT